jgi:hypothetical protein
MAEQYRCYFISRDGRARSLASIAANDPMSAIAMAVERYRLLDYGTVEVWLNRDRVLRYEKPRVAAR